MLLVMGSCSNPKMPLNLPDGVLGQGQLLQIVKAPCDWISGGNGMTSSGKQVLVGRRAKTSLKASAGEATSIPA